jgi:hypothetical protein
VRVRQGAVKWVEIRRLCQVGGRVELTSGSGREEGSGSAAAGDVEREEGGGG